MELTKQKNNTNERSFDDVERLRSGDASCPALQKLQPKNYGVKMNYGLSPLFLGVYGCIYSLIWGLGRIRDILGVFGVFWAFLVHLRICTGI